MIRETPPEWAAAAHQTENRDVFERDVEGRVLLLQRRLEAFMQSVRLLPFEAQIAYFEERDVLQLRLDHAKSLFERSKHLDEAKWLLERSHVEAALLKAEQTFATLQ